MLVNREIDGVVSKGPSSRNLSILPGVQLNKGL